MFKYFQWQKHKEELNAQKKADLELTRANMIEVTATDVSLENKPGDKPNKISDCHKRRWDSVSHKHQSSDLNRRDSIEIILDNSCRSKVYDSPLPTSLTDGPLAKLWGGKTKPLLKPIHAKSTVRILAKLDKRLGRNKTKNVPKKVTAKSSEEEPTHLAFHLSYDVYLPKVNYRKTCPCSPNYRLVVCTPSEPLPSHEDNMSLTGSFNDAVPLLYAVCSISSVKFYCFSKIELPQMVGKG